ncbi:hypothetical protein C7974DRAFT_412489 [Boeremia exigua]|uniref:uncharacterized protein n=1 Tax=Boeremia exigua TaxID=749465 RepID=UPI001E8DEFF9|nr:uncharacterized protein C7974DRAFT_412489 [Boeremia exigua]KAH6633503.1 hypothetical protein C7974DRAFT_412489 [Boeremia exigua]
MARPIPDDENDDLVTHASRPSIKLAFDRPGPFILTEHTSRRSTLRSRAQRLKIPASITGIVDTQDIQRHAQPLAVIENPTNGFKIPRRHGGRTPGRSSTLVNLLEPMSPTKTTPVDRPASDASGSVDAPISLVQDTPLFSTDSAVAGILTAPLPTPQADRAPPLKKNVDTSGASSRLLVLPPKSAFLKTAPSSISPTVLRPVNSSMPPYIPTPMAVSLSNELLEASQAEPLETSQAEPGLPSFESLISPTASLADMLNDIRTFDPHLSLEDEQMSLLYKHNRNTDWSPHTIPKVELDREWWASTHPFMDYLWNETVKEVGQVLTEIGPSNMPAGYSSNIKHLVKPIGDTHQPLIILSSYPTMTTAQPEYGTVDDMSNRSMRLLYGKLGLERPGSKHGVLHLDETPHRVDKPVAEKANGRHFYKGVTGDKLPMRLRHIWEQFHFGLLDASKATVGLLLDLAYILGLRQLRRVWFCVVHPEHYHRCTTYDVTDGGALYLRAFRERLIDIAFVMAFGAPSPRPAYLSTKLYFTDPGSGTIILNRVLETISSPNMQMLQYLFAKPDMTITSNLKSHLERSRSSKLRDRAAEIFGLAAGASLPFDSGESYWSSVSVQSALGPYAASFLAVWRQRKGAHEESRTTQGARQRSKIANMNPDELAAHRLKMNLANEASKAKRTPEQKEKMRQEQNLQRRLKRAQRTQEEIERDNYMQRKKYGDAHPQKRARKDD